MSVCAFLPCFLATIGLLPREEPMPPAVSVDVQLAGQPGSSLTLRITVNSHDSRPLETVPSALPWGTRYSMLLVAMRVDSTGEVIESPLSSADPLEEEPITLKPRQSIAGEIDLWSRFPAVHEALKVQDVILFWSYCFSAKGLGFSKRTGGWVLIPSSKR